MRHSPAKNTQNLLVPPPSNLNFHLIAPPPLQHNCSIKKSIHASKPAVQIRIISRGDPNYKMRIRFYLDPLSGMILYSIRYGTVVV